MTQPSTSTEPSAITDVFHPDAMAALAALTGVGDDEDPPDWFERALCAQTDPEAFFPEKGGSTREAKQICSGCEVRSQCLEYALGHDERFGIWGALSERERRQLKRRAQPADADTAEPVQPEIPEPRREEYRPSRESAPPSGRPAGPGLAASLPTEPRGHRPRGQRPERPTSTFPAHARAAASPEQTPGPDSRRPATRSTGRGSRTKPARATRTGRRTPAPRTATAATGTDQATVEAPATGREVAPADDPAAAVAGATSPSPPPDDGRDGETDRELRDAVRLVLAGQAGHPGGEHIDPAAVLDLATAIGAGTAIDPSRGETGMRERRAAAVATVVSGALTRGAAARAMGLPSQDVAYWVRLHLEAMPLVDPREVGGPENRPRAGRRASTASR